MEGDHAAEGTQRAGFRLGFSIYAPPFLSFLLPSSQRGLSGPPAHGAPTACGAFGGAVHVPEVSLSLSLSLLLLPLILLLVRLQHRRGTRSKHALRDSSLPETPSSLEGRGGLLCLPARTCAPPL